jgi:hypothetical protein
MSRALASVPVIQFGNSPAQRHAVQIDASQDTPAWAPASNTSSPPALGELGANASQTLVWQARL